MVKVLANSVAPDEMPRFAVFHLCVHCLPMTRLGISSLQWIKVCIVFTYDLSLLNRVRMAYPAKSKYDCNKCETNKS